jgi:cytoskeletal protein CcmA (bactofilin family)
MFSSNRKNQAPAVSAAATSLIAGGVTLRGDILFSGSLHLDGAVEGSIHADPGSDGVLTISETGRVVGRIEVPHAPQTIRQLTQAAIEAAPVLDEA